MNMPCSKPQSMRSMSMSVLVAKRVLAPGRQESYRRISTITLAIQRRMNTQEQAHAMTMAMAIREGRMGGICEFSTSATKNTDEEKNIQSSNNEMEFDKTDSMRYDDSMELQQLADAFASARFSIEDATDSLGTTYFNEDVEDAHACVNETFTRYEHVLSRVNEKERIRIKESWQLRMEQLRAELEALKLKAAEE